MLRASGYRFVTPTPATHQRVNARPSNREARSLTDVLGWSRPFRAGVLPPEVEQLLTTAGALVPAGDLQRSAVRFSTVDAAAGAPGEPEGASAIYVHSAFPTTDVDSVFFGPDTYRFIDMLRRVVTPARRLVEVCAGSGAAGLTLCGRVDQVVLADINHAALRHARINAALAGARAVEVVESNVLAGVAGELDVVIAHPPFMIDPGRRLYRNGGGDLGIDLSVRIVRDALARLEPGGQIVLYTGSPVVNGEHPLRAALEPVLASRRCDHTWEERDPDVFGEELESEEYQHVDRLSVIGLVVHVR